MGTLTSSHANDLDPPNLNWIANYIWGIADDVLPDVYVRGKYRDVVLPMTVLHRLDAVLEPTKQAVLDMKAKLDEMGIADQKVPLRQAAGQAFYNTSRFTLHDLRARASAQQLKADFEDYLAGFSPTVQEILENFEFRNQIPRLSRADALGSLIEKLTSHDINLGPEPVVDTDGTLRHPGLDNHGMGTIFEELIRRFNEENNEEAGEHFTPRDAVELMAKRTGCAGAAPAHRQASRLRGHVGDRLLRRRGVSRAVAPIGRAVHVGGGQARGLSRHRGRTPGGSPTCPPGAAVHRSGASGEGRGDAGGQEPGERVR